MDREIKAFVCGKDGCKVNCGDMAEIKELIDQWDSQIDERIKKRKASGCWTPDRAGCDCPACGGFND